MTSEEEVTIKTTSGWGFNADSADAVVVDEVQNISKLSDLTAEKSIGMFVKLHGWVYSTRAQGGGRIVFIDLAMVRP